MQHVVGHHSFADRMADRQFRVSDFFAFGVKAQTADQTGEYVFFAQAVFGFAAEIDFFAADLNHAAFVRESRGIGQLDRQVGAGNRVDQLGFVGSETGVLVNTCVQPCGHLLRAQCFACLEG